MAPTMDLPTTKDLIDKLPALRPTTVLHRTPWRPPTAVSSKGIYITLEDGRELVDAAGGAAVTCLGHGHPGAIAAIREQAEKMSYVYNMQLTNAPAEELGNVLVESGKGAFAACSFVCGGSEAMEAAIKLARQYFWETGQQNRKYFIARQMSYHGNTIGTLSLAYHPTRRAPYAAIMDSDHFHHVSPAYAARFQKEGESEEAYVQRLKDELEAKFEELGGQNVIAFVAETVVGATTGVVPAPKGYFKACSEICKKYGALFILDEVMSGMGRMGTMHAWESFGDGVPPDIQAVAKGLGGGYASIGAVLMSARVRDGLYCGYSMHGHTYQANPLACATSLAVQRAIAEGDLLANCRKQGAYIEELLRKRLLGPNSMAKPYTFDIRGGGGFWAVEFDFDAPNATNLDLKGQKFAMLVQAKCMDNGLVIMGFTGGANLEGTKGDHVVLAPPYNITPDEVEIIVERLVQSIEDVIYAHVRK